MRLFATLATLVFSMNVYAENVVCTHKEDKRTLATETVDGGCKLSYTKAGETKEIATQKVGSEKCESVAAGIRSKLEASGFKCE